MSYPCCGANAGAASLLCHVRDAGNTVYIHRKGARYQNKSASLSVVSVSRNSRGGIVHTSLDDFRCTDAPTYA